MLTKSDDGIGSGILKGKGPDDTEFKSLTLSCSGSPYKDTGLAGCLEVTKSGTVGYYLENDAAKSDQKDLEAV